MVKVKLDHMYVSVKDMNRAIKFYEDLLGMKATHREKNTWTDFDTGHNFYFGLVDYKIISDKRITGNNTVPVFWADDVDKVFKKVKKWGCKFIDKPTNLNFTDYPYRCFQFYDTEGNLIEIAKYNKN